MMPIVRTSYFAIIICTRRNTQMAGNLPGVPFDLSVVTKLASEAIMLSRAGMPPFVIGCHFRDCVVLSSAISYSHLFTKSLGKNLRRLFVGMYDASQLFFHGEHPKAEVAVILPIVGQCLDHFSSLGRHVNVLPSQLAHHASLPGSFLVNALLQMKVCKRH